jgi:hypothetical protein
MQLRYLFLGLAYTLILLSHTIPAATVLKVNNSIVKLSTPIILHNNNYYLPLRDILPSLKGSLIKSRKHHHYILKLPKYNIETILRPRRKDISVNGIRHYLPAPSLFLDGRLHVPVPAFFNYLGFKVFSKQSKLSIFPRRYDTRSTPHTKNAPNTLKQTKILPPMEKDRPLHIAYDTRKSTISTQFFYKNNILFANLIPFFKSINYTFEITKTGFLLTKKHHTIQFFINKNIAKSQFINHQTTLFLSASPIKKNNAFYLPVESTINAFFYGIKWNARTRTIQLLSIINDIDFIKEDDRYILQINASHPITFKNFKRHPWLNGYLLDIPNSKIILTTNSTKLSHITKIHSKTTLTHNNTN